MNAMPDHDRLSSLILEHWSRYQPTMLQQFQSEGTLEKELEAMVERFADRLFLLISVERMEYTQAWETTVDEFR
jgi:hypothetical protein